MEKLEHLKYPIGRFEYGKSYSLHDTRKNIKTIAALPKELKKIIKKVSRHQLGKPYRNGGWTVRQVIHHICDSHVNAYIRMKMAATEDNPTIKPYDERAWAELESGKDASVKLSLALLKVLHKKWVDFMEALSEDDLKKGYYHPAAKRTVLLPEAIALYAWHSEHHLAHIHLVTDSKSHTDLSVKLHTMPSTETPEGAAPAAKTSKTTADAPKKPGRPTKTAADNSAAPAAKTPKTTADAPKKPGRPAKTAADASAAPAAKTPKTTADAPKKPGRPAKTAADNSAAPAAKTPKTTADAPKKPGRPAKTAADNSATPAAKTPKTTADAPKKPGRPAKTAADNSAAPAAKTPKTTADAPKKPGRPAKTAAEKVVKTPIPPEQLREIRIKALAKAREAKAANNPAKPKKDPNEPKLTREEALAKAREARAAKHPPKPKEATDQPKMSRSEALKLARAKKAAKKGLTAIPEQPPVDTPAVEAPAVRKAGRPPKKKA